MKIDISRLGLTEKDIEDWLYENPAEIAASYSNGPIAKWIGRQYRLPSGIADLVGVREDGRLVVIEVKNVAIAKAALTQVCRYAADLSEIVALRMEYPARDSNRFPYIEKIVIGPSIDTQTFNEASALDIKVIAFAGSLNIELNRLFRSHEQYIELREKYHEISYRPEWQIYGQHATDAATSDQDKRYRAAYAEHASSEIAASLQRDEIDRFFDEISADDGSEEP